MPWLFFCCDENVNDTVHSVANPPNQMCLPFFPCPPQYNRSRSAISLLLRISLPMFPQIQDAVDSTDRHFAHQPPPDDRFLRGMLGVQKQPITRHRRPENLEYTVASFQERKKKTTDESF